MRQPKPLGESGPPKSVADRRSQISDPCHVPSGSGSPSPRLDQSAFTLCHGQQATARLALTPDLLHVEAISSAAPFLCGEICLPCDSNTRRDVCHPSWMETGGSPSFAQGWDLQCPISVPPRARPPSPPPTGCGRNKGLCAKPFFWGLYFSFLFMPEANS